LRGFILMWAFRLFYGYVAPNVRHRMVETYDFFGSVDNLRKNYASDKSSKQESNQTPGFASSQKYEKTATVKSQTSKFENDALEIKASTSSYKGVIQYEQNTGNKGDRELHLMIGINPEKFDAFYQKIQGIGTVRSTEITKIDKTNEYRQLNAKKASLEKTLNSLNELKSRGGAIADYISLHDKILEIETIMQELGVELGNFDTENEFCTIKFSLFEGAAKKKITFVERLMEALEWTVYHYAIMLLAFLTLNCSIFVLLLVIDKLKLMKTIGNKLNG
jgi:hypothetical protein